MGTDDNQTLILILILIIIISILIMTIYYYTHLSALEIILQDTICSYFGDAVMAKEACELLIELIQAEKDLLIDGILNGTAPSDVVKRNGIAYLEVHTSIF